MLGDMSLRFAEEILLLALDDATGKLHPVPEGALRLAVAGGLIMELAFAGVVDTDDQALHVLSRASTGDALLDEVVAVLPAEESLGLARALSIVAADHERWKARLFDELTTRGILRREEHRLLFVLHERRYPVVDDREEQEVRARIRAVVLDAEAIPDPRDVVIIGLVEACDLGKVVFSDEELESCRERLRTLSKMDFVCQALGRAVNQIQSALLEVMAYSGM